MHMAINIAQRQSVGDDRCRCRCRFRCLFRFRFRQLKRK